MSGGDDDGSDSTASLANKGSYRPAHPPLARGACVDRYVIVGELGAGGMGVVYKAFDPELGRPIALKLLNTLGGTSGALRDRLVREAQALARLSHPNVIAVHDVGTFGSDVFIAMEFVEGQTLRAWLKEKPRRQREILDVFLAAGQGLAAAHRAGLVHRDFKPDNVIVGARPQSANASGVELGDGRVRVLDFGLARDATTGWAPYEWGEEGEATREQSIGRIVRSETTTAPEGRRASPHPAQQPAPAEAVIKPVASGASLASPLTHAGSILGTPRYMAPEQHRGEVADERADQFSFCVALYDALYGEFPFEGRGLEEFEDNVLEGRVQDPPAGSGVPRWLRGVLLRGLLVDPAQRHESMDALLAHLAPPRSERALWLTLGAAALTAGVGVWGVLGARARGLERAQLCQGAPMRLEGVWDGNTKGRVHDALLATGKAYAPDAWKNVEQTIDRYTAGWVRMHKDSCEATRLRGEQSDATMTLRMACLDRKLQGVSALVNVLADADSAMLEKAGSAAAELSSIDECGDTSGLLGVEGSLPSDPGLRERIKAIREALSRAQALRLAGRIPNAIALAETAVAEAREVGNDVIVAEALTEEGRGRAHLEPERGAKLLTEAFWPAFASRLDRTAVSAASNAAREYALTLHPDDAELWAKLAQAGLRRMGGDDELESELWSARSVRALETHRFEEQVQDTARASHLTERRFGPDDLRTIAKEEDELNAISNVSRNFEAWQARGPLLAREEKLLGPLHPTVADALMDLGDDDVDVGHLAEAHAHLERAEALFRVLGATNTVAWTTLRSYEVRLAEAEGRTGDVDAIGRETLATFDAMGRGYSGMALFLRRQLALNDARQGHEGQALEALNRLMQDAIKRYGKDASLISFHSGFARIHLRTGALAAAREDAEKAAAGALADSGEGSCSVADERLVLAQVLVAQGHAAEALAMIDAGEPALLRAQGDRGPSVEETRRIRGEALAALGRFDEAVAALRSATAIAESDGLDPAERESIRVALARALAKSGRGRDGGD